MLWVAVGIALIIGVSLAVLGGGGSVLTVPLLLYVVGLDAKESIAVSLLVVGVTSAVASIGHAKNRRVDWRRALLVGSAAMLGSYLGGRSAEYVPGRFLLALFAVMMLGTAIALARKATPASDVPGPGRQSALKVIVIGFVIGVVTGLVGAGGGFLIVPALVLLCGLDMPKAVGTSLVVIALKSFTGLAGYLTVVDIPWITAWSIAIAASLGSIAAFPLFGRLSNDVLKYMFSTFLIAMAGVILVQEVVFGS